MSVCFLKLFLKFRKLKTSTDQISQQLYNLMANLENANNADGKELRVWSDGCYDMLHFGHANQLRRAKAMGTKLVVGVHSDRDISIHKGPPVFNEEERYTLMRSIRWVDEVIEGSTYFPTVDTLDEHNCAFHVHGDDISLSADGTDVLDHLKAADRYREIPRTEGISTTALVSRILARINGANVQPVNESPWTMSSTAEEAPKLPADYIAHFAGQLHHYEEDLIVQKNASHKGMDDIGTHHQSHRRVVVYVSGHFDLFHIGHLRFLEAASKMGDHLIVGLYGYEEEDKVDEPCKGLRPQPEPIMTLYERALSLLAYRQVSEVIMGVPRCISEAFIHHYGINLVARGQQSRFPSKGIDCFEVPKRMGIYHQIHSGSNVTTGQIIERILARLEEYKLRNDKKQRKELAAYQALQ